MSELQTICLLNDSFPPLIDGVANAVRNYAGVITEMGGSAVVATPDYPEADDSAFPFPVLRYPSVDTRQLFGYRAGVPFSPKLYSRLEEEHVSILHSHCPIASTILARQIREGLDVPLVFTYHTKFDIDIANALHSRLLQEGAIHALVTNVAACDEVWVVSRGAGENLRSLGYEGQMTVMPNGVDVPRGRVAPEAVAAAVQGMDLPADVPVYLFVGRLMWYKGLRIILDALAKIRSAGAPFRMVFIGGGGDEEEVREYARKLGLADRVFFTGPIRDREVIRAWYCRADLFLFPSTFDTNGLVVREAAACSLPSVLIAGSCAAEDVTDGVNAFLIEENAESMAAMLLSLQNAPERVREAGARAASELYLSWSDAVARAYERYGEIVDNYRAGRYERRANLSDMVFAMQGALMEKLSRMDDLGSSMNDYLARPLDRIGDLLLRQ